LEIGDNPRAARVLKTTPRAGRAVSSQSFKTCATAAATMRP
jgi:hypothetical protein